MVNTYWKFRRRQSVAARAAQWTAFANLFFFIGALALLQIGALTPYGMFIAVLSSIGFAIITLILLAWGLVDLWRVGAKAGWSSIRALLVTSIIIAPFMGAYILALSLPPTYDSSSNLAFPPEYPTGSRGEVEQLPFLETFLARDIIVQEDRRAIETRRFVKDYGVVRDIAVQLARDFNWQEESRSGNHLSDVRIGYTARTLLFNLPIDVVLQVTELENGVSVDMRSALRVGVPDLGYNDRNIKKYFEALEERILALSIGQSNL